MSDPKVLERIAKLLRLAAPVSGTSEAERASAALEAARLIHEHGVAIAHAEEKPSKRGKVSSGAWVKTQSLDHCSCSYCGQLISPRDVVWLRIVNDQREFRHNAGPCKVA